MGSSLSGAYPFARKERDFTRFGLLYESDWEGKVRAYKALYKST